MIVDKDRDTEENTKAGPSEAPGTESQVLVKTPEETIQESTGAENVELDVDKVNLKALARDLYQTGLALGLTPDEAALLTSEMELPAVHQQPK